MMRLATCGFKVSEAAFGLEGYFRIQKDRISLVLFVAVMTLVESPGSHEISENHRESTKRNPLAQA